MDFAVIAACLVVGWIFLCVISTERQRAFDERVYSEMAMKSSDLPAQKPLDTAKN